MKSKDFSLIPIVIFPIQVEDWDRPLFYRDGESKSFSLTRSPTNWKYKNTIESVSVKRGCTLEVRLNRKLNQTVKR